MAIGYKTVPIGSDGWEWSTTNYWDTVSRRQGEMRDQQIEYMRRRQQELNNYYDDPRKAQCQPDYFAEEVRRQEMEAIKEQEELKAVEDGIKKIEEEEKKLKDLIAYYYSRR